MKRYKKPPPVQTVMCGSCPFRQDEGALDLDPSTFANIMSYLLEGTNHECSHAAFIGQNRPIIICRGGRNFQLNMWHGMGLLDAPTDEALAAKMASIGIATHNG